MAALFPLKGDETALLKAVRNADAKFAGDLEPKTRVSRIERIGVASAIGARESLTRALAAFRKSLFVPAPKREYVVHYSETPITGLAAWEKVAPKPESQLMDRQYGGRMDFLVTDVATGNRGEGIGTEKAAKDAAVPSIQIVRDGLHRPFRGFLHHALVERLRHADSLQWHGLGVRERPLGTRRQGRVERHRVDPRALHMGAARLRHARYLAEKFAE